MRETGQPSDPIWSDWAGSEPGSSICGVQVTGPVRQVVLTYDDGPEPGGTDRIAGVLADRACTATFFVLLSRVRRYPALFADLVAAGHEIGLHGVDHQRLTNLDPGAVQRRTAEAKEELQDALGRPVSWFRPPYGGQSPATWRAVVAAGLVPVLWTVTLRDWLDVPMAERLDAASGFTEPGAIVLGHDGYASLGDGVDDGPAPRLDRGELARRLLDRYSGMDLTGCSLGQALTSGTPIRRIWLTDQ
ncbi:MAG TPA: polysaccharide deacetylase family protein [Streptosporangiaceae bacterium]|nr:polysaccharide deacetylase family protein [Streptosporangiaceae bacterium]